MKYILASGSPRRIELCKRLNENFVVCPSSADENIDCFFDKETQKKLLETAPWEISVAIATKKAEEVAKKFPDDLVLGADTGVFFENEMIGKPKDEEDARRILKKLSGKMHEVITGFCVICGKAKYCGYESTKVFFNALSSDMIEAYIASGLYKGKAGAYGVQDGFELVEKLDGDYYNVMGFPLEKIQNTIDKVI